MHLFWTMGQGESVDFYHGRVDVAPTTADSEVSQQITVPLDMYEPTVSLQYRVVSQPEAGNRLRLTISNGATTTEVISIVPTGDDWTHVWSDSDSHGSLAPRS
jgi:hypothetical protein